MTMPGFTAEASLGRPRTLFGSATAALPPGSTRSTWQGMPPPARLLPQQGIPIYGRWCGPGFGGSGPPIDKVDQVCCLHDKCYDDRGYFDCSCDHELLQRMPLAIADASTPPDGQAAGLAAMSFFAASPCLCHQICAPLVGCIPFAPNPGIPGTKLCPPPWA